jgi:hypothetical protein
MFGLKKAPTTLNATAVMPLTESNLDFLKKLQMRHIDQIPEGANYIAFLEDGDACFLETIETGSILTPFPHMKMVTYHTDIPVQF